MAGDVDESVADTLALSEWVLRNGYGPLVLAGWSMGSAVVADAAQVLW